MKKYLLFSLDWVMKQRNTVNASILLLVSVSMITLVMTDSAFSSLTTIEHWDFQAGFRLGKEKAMAQKISEELDSIWKKVNDLTGGTLPLKLRLETTNKGLASKPILEENRFGVELNEIHIKKDTSQDAIERIAHEVTHVALYRISYGKSSIWENKFLDEGIASYVGALVAGKLDYFDHWSKIYAQEDLHTGLANLELLRDWNNTVYSKQVDGIRKYLKENAGRVPTEEEFHQKLGFRSYFTSYSFVKFFIDNYDLKRLLEAMTEIGKGEPQSTAFEKATGKSLNALFAEWHSSLSK